MNKPYAVLDLGYKELILSTGRIVKAEVSAYLFVDHGYDIAELEVDEQAWLESGDKIVCMIRVIARHMGTGIEANEFLTGVLVGDHTQETERMVIKEHGLVEEAATALNKNLNQAIEALI